MAKKTSSNIVHEYFSKDLEGDRILVKVNPITFFGSEILIGKDGKVELREMEFDSEIFEDLKEDGFEKANPLEFNLIISGLL
ncbi:MAG TPA: hypothetical protein VIM65_01155 [Cyclobacteriaceae bacterium]